MGEGFSCRNELEVCIYTLVALFLYETYMHQLQTIMNNKITEVVYLCTSHQIILFYFLIFLGDASRFCDQILLHCNFNFILTKLLLRSNSFLLQFEIYFKKTP